MLKNFCHIKLYFLSILIIVFVLALQINTSYAGEKVKKSSDDPIVASFGHFKIRFSEYKAEYFEVLKQPEIYDSKKLRAGILDNLIINKILSDQATKMQLNRDEKLQRSIEAYKDKCLRDEHFQKVIVPKIKIDDSIIHRVYVYEKSQRRVKHLFFKTKVSADSAYKLLKHGASFKNIAEKIFKNDTALANSGGDLGWVNWDQLDYNLAMAAFGLPLNTYSKPVKSQWGYHILEVTGYRVDPLISKYDYAVHKYRAKLIIEYRKGEQIADEYIKRMLKNSNIIVYPRVMMLVQKDLQHKFIRKPNQFDNMFPIHLSDKEINLEEESLWDARHEVMAKINGKPYTVEDFMFELPYVPYDVVYNNFKESFDYAVRDFLITEEAKKLGLEKNEGVITKTILFKENSLALKLKKMLVSNVKVSENEIKKYYDENQNQIKGAPYNMMRPIIKEQIKENKKNEVVPEYVKMLLKNLKITKHLNIINKYYNNLYNGNFVDNGNI